MLKQLRASGGFVLSLEDQLIHVDPGPGAILKAKEYGVDLCRLTAVVVSHRHQDHFNDAVLSIECMTKGATEKRGAFLSNRTVIKGGRDYPPVVDRYHLKFIEVARALRPGDSVTLGKVRVTATPTRHSDAEGLGFVFEGEGLRIGYTGDGEYFPGMEKHFRDCDYLIMNVLRPRSDSWPGHMNSEGARKLLAKAKPKRAIMKHLGMKMLRGVAEQEASWIEKETGMKTTVARDGMSISHGLAEEGGRTLDRFLEEDGD